jgi:two-component system, response regulator
MWKTRLFGGVNPAPLSVLLVEDSEDDAFFFTRALEKTRLPCFCAHVLDGGEAVEYLAAARDGAPGAPPLPAIIFLDLKLPAMNGFEVLKWIARQQFSPPLQVAILSGSDQASDVQAARDLGAREYLVKPLSPEELLRRLAPIANPMLAASVPEVPQPRA